MSLFKGSVQWIRDQFTAPDEDDLIDESYDDLYEEEEPTEQAGALPARSVRPQELVIITPGSYRDAKAIVDALQQGLVVFVCLGNLDSTIAARIVDFVGGAVYLLHASIQLMNEDTLLLTPESVSITTDPLAPSDAFPQWRAKL